jgi:hypothetical protein
VGLDETSKQMIVETREPIPAKLSLDARCVTITSCPEGGEWRKIDITPAVERCISRIANCEADQ